MHPAREHPARTTDRLTTTALPAWFVARSHVLPASAGQLTGSNRAGRISRGTAGGCFQDAVIPNAFRRPCRTAQETQSDGWNIESEMQVCDRLIRRLANRLLV